MRNRKIGLLILLLIGLSACGRDTISQTGTLGDQCALGTPVQSVDSCNTCFCQLNSQGIPVVMCTQMYCN